MIDRTAPSRRPDGPNDGTQRWESLLFCHWEVTPDALRPLVPKHLQIDTFDGKTYIGIVPFKMRRIRPRWLPSRLAIDFLETNVRTYVVFNDQPGVYFFSLEASSCLAVIAGRAGWSLPYHYAKMYSIAAPITPDAPTAGITDSPEVGPCSNQQGMRYQYRSRRVGSSACHDVSFRLADELGPSAPGTLEHFLLERYLLFAQRNNRITIGQVHHQSYHAYQAVVDDISDTLAIASQLPSCNRQPDLAHYCAGVDVEVFSGRD